MGFNKNEAEDLLAATGRHCCICGVLHQVQLHHITPKEEGGTDNIDNAIPLCPNCHDEVHAGRASGRTSRSYSARELRLHIQRTRRLVENQGKWTPGSQVWEADRDLILFYAQCLDRPAFRAHFDQEMSFAAFDHAMEDSLVALNTGYWRLRDGTLIARAEGKVAIVSGAWREKLDKVVSLIEGVRKRFREVVGFDHMRYETRCLRGRDFDIEFGPAFRGDRELSRWMDEQRNQAIELLNSILADIGHPPLQSIPSW